MNYIWILFLIASSILGAYCAKLSNMKVPYGSLYVFLSSMIGLSIWMWVSRTTKNLLFDSVVYDVVMSVAFITGFVLFKCGTAFSVVNWIGLIIAVIGLVLMKL